MEIEICGVKKIHIYIRSSGAKGFRKDDEMKNLRFLLMILIFALSTVSAYAENRMKIVYFNNYPPFSWMENGKMKGIFIDALTEAIQVQMGINVSHEGYPWARAQLMVKTNKADAFVTVPTDERRRYTKISDEPIITATFTLFAPKESKQIKELENVKTLSDLKGIRLINYLGSGWGKANLKDMHVTWKPTLNKVLFLLSKNRYEAFVDTSQVVRFNIKKLGYQDQIIEIPTILDTTSFNLCIGKKSPYAKIIPRFNETVKRMKIDGKLKKISDKYK